MTLQLIKAKFCGPSWVNGGPSSEAKANEKAQTAYFNQVVAQQNTQFQENQDQLKAIKAVWDPILAAGPGQFGFTPEETATLRSEITSSGAQATESTVNAEKLAEQQAGGGRSQITTGGQDAIDAMTRVLGQQSTAKRQSDLTILGDEQGRTNFNNATSVLAGASQNLAPAVGTGNVANGAGSNATKAIQLADSERSSLLGSILGGAASSIVGGLTGGLGTEMSKVGSGNFGW